MRFVTFIMNQDSINKIRRGLPEIDQRDQNNNADLMSIGVFGQTFICVQKRDNRCDVINTKKQRCLPILSNEG